MNIKNHMLIALAIICTTTFIFNYTSDKATQRPLTTAEAALAGTVAGCAELTIGNPLNNTKVRLQQQLAPTINPRILYKNSILTAMCLGPTTMIQGACNQALNDKVFDGKPCLPSAAISGAFSGLIATPMDAIAQYRLTMETSIVKSALQAPIAKGIFATATRETMWSSGVFFIRPAFKPIIQEHIDNELTAKILSGAAVGTGVAVISHPSDTIATVLRQSAIQNKMSPEMLKKQKNILPPMRNELDTIRYIQQTQGAKGFYPGALTRATRAGIAIIVIGEVFDKTAEQLTKNN